MNSSHAFARVIPLLRTPIQVDGFDYRIPEGLIVTPGDLVVTPFRRQRIVGLVETLLSDSAFGTKASAILHPYGNLRMPPSFLQLLRWTAERTLSSRPSVLHAWLRTLPKRPALNVPMPLFPNRDNTGRIETHWTRIPETELLARARALIAEEKRVLILSPWKTRAERIHRALPESFLLSSEQSMGGYSDTWQRFARAEGRVLIATRIGAWLMPFADHVLLDEPENDDHKQDELSPRYDVRKMVAWMGTFDRCPIETFGITPPLHVQALAPTIAPAIRTFIYDPGGRSALSCIQADALLTLEAHIGPRVIIHPIRGLLAHLTCRDCGWQPTCSTCSYPVALEVSGPFCRLCHKIVEVPLACPTCGNVDFGKSFPGIERLKEAWKMHGPPGTIEWRDLSNEQMDAPFAPESFVLVTLPNLLGGVVEDIRRHERQCVTLRRLGARVQEAEGILGLQGTEEEMNQWLSWLSQTGVTNFFQAERSSRALFHYPPSARRIKFLLDQGEAKNGTWREHAQRELHGLGQWEGPFSITYGTAEKKQRVIWHLIVSPDIPEATLIERLSPLTKGAKIDLDPIAFFK